MTIGPNRRVEGYRIGRMLGRGGMGVVYEAVQVTLDRSVALKVLKPELADDPAFVARFRREARLQASIEHPHVLDVYEVGETSEGELFIAMRLVAGPTIAELTRSGELDAARTVRLLEQVGGAIDAAHEGGLLHRDVKPQNMLVEASRDEAHLSDFGLSRSASDSVTASRPTVGTVAYMSPEVIRGEEPGPAADRYAFAAALFQCLTGDVPFARGSDAAVLFAHVADPPPRISERRPELTAALDGIFERALAKDPWDRPNSAAGLVASVRRALGERVAEIGPARLDGGQGFADTKPSGTPVTAPSAAQPRRARWIAAAAAALALGAGAVALSGWTEDEDATQEVPVPALAPGAEAIGSELPAPSASLDCRGEAPGRDSPPCAIFQSDLPEGTTLVPADGLIGSWAVRGASGEMAIEVIRLRGDETVRVQRSQWESVNNPSPHEFETELTVERGDAIGLVLGSGSSVGVADTEGASTLRWIDPEDGFYGSPDRGVGTGFDYELAMRAEFVAGAIAEAPEKLQGVAAARAPRGTVRERSTVRISGPRATLTLTLVETGDRVALDLFEGGRRTARTYLPGLLPGGQPVDLMVEPGEGIAGVGIWWVNPNSGRSIFRGFEASPGQLDYFG